MEPGQILIYRLEGRGVSGFIDFGQHEMQPESAIPSLTNWGLIILMVLIVGSTIFVWLRKRTVAALP